MGAAVLLERGGGFDALEETGILIIVVLLGVEPLPPILVLLVVSVETGSVVVVSVDGAEEVAVRIGSVPVVEFEAPVAEIKGSEAAELVAKSGELATDEILAMADEAPSEAAEAAEGAAEATVVNVEEVVAAASVVSDDASAVPGELAALVRGTIRAGAFVVCEPTFKEAADAALVVSNIAEPETLDAMALSCSAADSAALEASAAEAESSDEATAGVDMTTLTGAIVTGPVGMGAVVGS